MNIKKIINKLCKILNPEDAKFPMKVDNIDKISLSPGETTYIVLIKNKNMSFMANAKKLKEKKSLFDSFSPDDRKMLEADLDGKLLDHISEKDN